MDELNVIREVRELKTQLSYSKSIGFFMGAGTSCALGLPNIAQLTNRIAETLTGKMLAIFQIIRADLMASTSGASVSIEDILNHVRRIREITHERADSEFIGVDGQSAKELDIQICRIIYNVLTEKESVADLSVPKKFFAWLTMQNRDCSKELFTTNYDLIIERSLEAIRAPYFDGFIGSYEPFFWQESVEVFPKKTDLTANWIRLWKIHGSLSWFWKANSHSNSQKIIRLGKVEKIENEKNEIVIYPSKDKYDSSRRQPFLVYFDRLRSYLCSGELLFIVSGYSFLDQHINEIIFNALRQNNRLHVIVFFYADSEVDRLSSISSGYLNLSVFGPRKGIVNGICGNWKSDPDELLETNTATYWDEAEKKLLLGDFRSLADFLVDNSGRKREIETVAHEN